jgi:hypothetical protein
MRKNLSNKKGPPTFALPLECQMNAESAHDKEQRNPEPAEVEGG